MSGLALAISLQRFALDVDFEIYEGAAELAEIGAGIGLAPRTWAMVQALGIEDTLLEISGDGDRPSERYTRSIMTWAYTPNRAVISLVHRKSDQAEGVDFDRVEVTGERRAVFRATAGPNKKTQRETTRSTGRIYRTRSCSWSNHGTRSAWASESLLTSSLMTVSSYASKMVPRRDATSCLDATAFVRSSEPRCILTSLRLRSVLGSLRRPPSYVLTRRPCFREKRCTDA